MLTVNTTASKHCMTFTQSIRERLTWPPCHGEDCCCAASSPTCSPAPASSLKANSLLSCVALSTLSKGKSCRVACLLMPSALCLELLALSLSMYLLVLGPLRMQAEEKGTRIDAPIADAGTWRLRSARAQPCTPMFVRCWSTICRSESVTCHVCVCQYYEKTRQVWHVCIYTLYLCMHYITCIHISCIRIYTVYIYTLYVYTHCITCIHIYVCTHI